jgi:hypothetical protein
MTSQLVGTGQTSRTREKRGLSQVSFLDSALSRYVIDARFLLGIECPPTFKGFVQLLVEG